MSFHTLLIISGICLISAIVLTFFRFRRRYLSAMRLTAITLLVGISILIIRYPLLRQAGEQPLTAALHGLIRTVDTISHGENLTSVINEGTEYILTADSTAPAELSAAPAPTAAPADAAEVAVAPAPPAAEAAVPPSDGNAVPDAAAAPAPETQDPSLHSTDDNFAHHYALYVTIQYILAPLLCGFALVKSLSLALSKARLACCRRPVFFFSRLTEESLLLGKSILDSMAESAERGHRCKPVLLCFIHTGNALSPEAETMWQELRRLGAIRVKDTLGRHLFPRFASCINCILCNQDEQSNLHDLTRLLQAERDPAQHRRMLRKCSMKYFVFAQSRHAEQVIDSLTGEYISADRSGRNRIICMLNPKENLAVHVLDSTPLHQFIATAENGQHRLNILIAGSTHLADRFLRNAYACGQMEDCRLSITLAAPDAEAFRDRLLASAPLMRHPELPLVKSNGDLRFVSIPDPTAIVDEALLHEADYVFVAFDSDEDNARCARRIRTVIERQKLCDPRRAAQNIAIVYAVEDIALHAMCLQVDAQHSGGAYTPCTMVPTGSRDKQNHTDILFGHTLLRRAFFMDKAYGGLEAPKMTPEGICRLQNEFVSFMNQAYQRRSSVATALHLSYREHWLSAAPSSDCAVLAEAEHRRWNAYMIMSGFVPPTQEQLEAYYYQGKATHKNEALRLHPCMVHSSIEQTPGLWDPAVPAADELDALSRRLHAMAAERLQDIMTRHHLYCPAPGQLAPKHLSRLGSDIKRISDSADRQLAEKLVGVLFRNYKQIDIDIVSQTQQILTLASDPDILDALRLFWLEGD